MESLLNLGRGLGTSLAGSGTWTARLNPSMRRSRLKPMSKKKAREIRRVGPQRREYLKKHHMCMFCRWKPSKHVHEITPGTSMRKLAYPDPTTWLALCPRCHQDVHSTLQWPVARQLAVKTKLDPENFDLDRINEILQHGARMQVDMQEVDKWLPGRGSA